jgi:hypothetical protein
MDSTECEAFIKDEAAKEDFQLSSEQLRLIRVSTGGNPLAMRWIAGQLANRHNTMGEVLSRFQQPTSRPLKFIFHASVAAQPPAARLILACASGFVGPFTTAALQYCSDISSRKYQQAVADLVNGSLLKYHTFRFLRSDRKALSAPARLYASKLFRTSQTQNAVHGRLSRYYVKLAESIGKDPTRFGTLEIELPNVIECVRRDRIDERYNNVVQIALALGYPDFLYVRGYWKELEDLLNGALKSALSLNYVRNAGTFLRDLAWLAFCKSNFRRALAYTHQARLVVLKSSDPHYRNRELAKI